VIYTSVSEAAYVIITVGLVSTFENISLVLTSGFSFFQLKKSTG
jgi:hypothetical protein